MSGTERKELSEPWRHLRARPGLAWPVKESLDCVGNQDTASVMGSGQCVRGKHVAGSVYSERQEQGHGWGGQPIIPTGLKAPHSQAAADMSLGGKSFPGFSISGC